MADAPPTRVIITGGTTEQPPGFNNADAFAFPNGLMAKAHLVSRPDLVRIDEDGNVSEIATMFVAGLKFEDWESVWINWTWNAEFSYFKFTCAEREQYPDPGVVLQFEPGQVVEIYLGGIQVINGVIVTRQVAYDGNQHLVELQGVSASWFAQRSSIDHATHDFNGKTFKEIAAEILKPTGIGFETVGEISELKFEAGATPSTGETIGQFLERLARDRKIIISNLPNGKFLFIGEHTGQNMGELVEGENIKKMQCVISVELARNEFRMLGSKRANDKEWGRKASEQEARIPGSLKQYSILIGAMEHPVWSSEELEKRVANEKMWSDDLASIQANITVYGWFRPLPTTVASIATIRIGPDTGHTIWQAGDEVTVHSPMAMLYNKTLKIKSVTWTQDNQGGTQTQLQCVNPLALNGKGAPIAKPKTNTDPPKTPDVPADERPNEPTSLPPATSDPSVTRPPPPTPAEPPPNPFSGFTPP